MILGGLFELIFKGYDLLSVLEHILLHFVEDYVLDI